MTSSGVNLTSFCTRKREVAFHGRWIFEEAEFKFIVVV